MERYSTYVPVPPIEDAPPNAGEDPNEGWPEAAIPKPVVPTLAGELCCWNWSPPIGPLMPPSPKFPILIVGREKKNSQILNLATKLQSRCVFRLFLVSISDSSREAWEQGYIFMLPFVRTMYDMETFLYTSHLCSVYIKCLPSSCAGAFLCCR